MLQYQNLVDTSGCDFCVLHDKNMFLFYLFLHLAASAAASVIFEDCGSAYDLEEVSIEGCDMRLPCYVTLGEDVPVEIKFHAGFVSSKLDQDVVININFISLRTNVTPEACATVDCPVRTDGATSFNSVMSVPTNMALNQRGYLRWRVYNENGRLVLCYAVLVQTRSSRQNLTRQTLAEAKIYQQHLEPPSSPPADRTNVQATDIPSLNQIVKRYFKRDT